jgi:hypothetical protein
MNAVPMHVVALQRQLVSVREILGGMLLLNGGRETLDVNNIFRLKMVQGDEDEVSFLLNFPTQKEVAVSLSIHPDEPIYIDYYVGEMGLTPSELVGAVMETEIRTRTKSIELPGDMDPRNGLLRSIIWGMEPHPHCEYVMPDYAVRIRSTKFLSDVIKGVKYAGMDNYIYRGKVKRHRPVKTGSSKYSAHVTFEDGATVKLNNVQHGIILKLRVGSELILSASGGSMLLVPSTIIPPNDADWEDQSW